MTATPLADGLRRRNIYRGSSTTVGVVGLALAIFGLVTGNVAAVIVGAVLFVVVGFALRLAANSALNTAIDVAAFGFHGEPVPATIPLHVREMHIGVFRKAMVVQGTTGASLDEAFRVEYGEFLDSV